jgi:dihydroorotate dehydrogenase
MYPRFRSLLFRLDPEEAHRLTLQLVRLAGYLPPTRWLLERMFTAPEKPVEAFGLRFNNPIGLAAGYDKDGIAIQGLSTLGFGHLEIGTVTPRSQPGNPRPRVFRLKEDQAIINRMGFPGNGMEAAAMSLQKTLKMSIGKHQSGKKILSSGKKHTGFNDTIIGVNIGKNKDTPLEEAVDDYVVLMNTFSGLADYLAINVSSPNTVGLRQLQGRKLLADLLKTIQEERQKLPAEKGSPIPILVKIDPDLSDEGLDDAIGVILDSGIDGIIAANTTLDRHGLINNQKNEEGGLSGAPLRARSERMLSRIIQRVDGIIPIISVGGIMSPEDVLRRLDMGAMLIQIYTGLVYSGPGLVKKILQVIR